MSRSSIQYLKTGCNRFYDLPVYFHASHLSEIYEKLVYMCNSSVDICSITLYIAAKDRRPMGLEKT